MILVMDRLLLLHKLKMTLMLYGVVSLVEQRIQTTGKLASSVMMMTVMRFLNIITTPTASKPWQQKVTTHSSSSIVSKDPMYIYLCI